MNYIIPEINELYIDYIEKCKYKHTGYTECHHIIAKCCGGKDTSDNKIDLYPEEHFYAHMLLYKENKNNYGLAEAFLLMSRGAGFEERQSIIKLAEEFGELKREAAIKHGERMRGHEVSQYQREQVSKANSHPHTEESIEKMRQAKIGMYDGSDNPNSKKYYWHEQDKIYDCGMDIIEAIGISPANFYKALNKESTHYFARKKATITKL